MIKSLILWILFFLLTPLFLFLAFIALLVGSQNGAHWFHIKWCQLFVFLTGIRIETRGQLLPVDGPVVYIANHNSLLDIFIVGAVLKRQYRWLAKDSLFKVPFMGFCMRLAGYIPVARESKSKSTDVLYDAARQVKGGKSVMIFPEGSRSKKATLGRFKQGAFVLAKKAQVPLQALSIKGTGSLLQKKKFFYLVKGGLIEVTVHPRIEAGQVATLSTADLMGRAEKLIETGLSQ